MSNRINLARLIALIRKETMQMVRDPSTFLVAVILPIILLFMFAYAVSLDIKNMPIGIIKQSDSAKAQSLAAKYSGTKFFVIVPQSDINEAKQNIILGKIRAIIIIPQNLDERIANQHSGALVEIIADGAQPNTARFVGNAAQFVAQQFLVENQYFGKMPNNPMIEMSPRYWFNAEIESRRTLIPGAMAIVMTMIGTLLTAMVVAREWERGTMEAIMASPSSVFEILIGKLLPYFMLGLIATLICAIMAVLVFHVPLRGSIFGLLAVSSAFLIPALGQGLLISAATKNQFLAAQLALMSGFLPAMMLSGFIYEISSMPIPLRIISHIVGARYYVDCLRSLFLVGDVWGVFLPNIGAMLLIGLGFFILSARATSRTLDGK
jgi:ABC-2 type transport system permease protein